VTFNPAVLTTTPSIESPRPHYQQYTGGGGASKGRAGAQPPPPPEPLLAANAHAPMQTGSGQGSHHPRPAPGGNRYSASTTDLGSKVKSSSTRKHCRTRRHFRIQPSSSQLAHPTDHNCEIRWHAMHSITCAEPLPVQCASSCSSVRTGHTSGTCNAYSGTMPLKEPLNLPGARAGAQRVLPASPHPAWGRFRPQQGSYNR
jgi:hypothetical protein